MINNLPSRIDRYPAKMVSHLAMKLVDRYALGASRLLDPFCGSGAILLAARMRGIPVSGIDINPISGLFTKVKLNGFSLKDAMSLTNELVSLARGIKNPIPIQWAAKDYWFTPATLDKYERLRAAAHYFDLDKSNNGAAVLLSIVLSVRLCSKADQRSPKPFISKQAIDSRKGRHFDPYQTIPALLNELGMYFESPYWKGEFEFVQMDITSENFPSEVVGRHSHVITSPPYVNAQDYFRNFKLELYVLEGILSYRVNHLREHFIGTERGKLLADIDPEQIKRYHSLLPELQMIGRKSPRLESVVHRYLCDIEKAFDTIKKCIDSKGTLVIVCGDNLIGGLRISTWQVLNTMLLERGFILFDFFTDAIRDRMLAPKRCGHKGLIKEETISAFHL